MEKTHQPATDVAETSSEDESRSQENDTTTVADETEALEPEAGEMATATDEEVTLWFAGEGNEEAIEVEEATEETIEVEEPAAEVEEATEETIEVEEPAAEVEEATEETIEVEEPAAEVEETTEEFEKTESQAAEGLQDQTTGFRWIEKTKAKALKAVDRERFEKEAGRTDRRALARFEKRHPGTKILIFPITLEADHERHLDGTFVAGTRMLLLCRNAKLSVWMSKNATKTGQVAQYGESHRTEQAGSITLVNVSDHAARGWAIISRRKMRDDQ